MNYLNQIGKKQLLIATTTGLLALPLIFYSWLHLLRPPRISQEKALFQGIVYRREVSPWDYYPKTGNRVNVVGQAIANSSSYSQHEPDWPVLCFNAKNRPQIETGGKCPQGTVQAVAGNTLLIEGGNPVGLNSGSGKGDSPKAYARVAVAIDKEGKKLWLVVIDGKQPLYSEGVTIAELTKIISDLGAYWALNLDGGGSTTLVTATPRQPIVLNAPIHTKLPMRQRPVANHLGFYALPEKPTF
ncbi:MAG: phosphodiester glycosidase family protein [Coleofasciculaceae cyanobacterium]